MLKPRIIIVEDDSKLRCELAEISTHAYIGHVIATFETAEDAIPEIIDLQPDVALIDLGLPGRLSGIDVIERILQANIITKPIVLTVFDDDGWLFSALRAGAEGYILKPVSRDGLIQAIHEVQRGGAPMSLSIARRILQECRKSVIGMAENPLLKSLTRRERQILDLFAAGFNAEGAADQLGISVWTVRCHTKNIYDKLEVTTRLEAVAIANGRHQGPNSTGASWSRAIFSFAHRKK